jgi:hypothetical protein
LRILSLKALSIFLPQKACQSAVIPKNCQPVDKAGARPYYPPRG